MRFLTDNRAQSIQVGAVLLFGVLVILLSSWQAFVIPNQNEGVEFNHNQEVQQQMTELRSTVISIPGAETTRSVTVDTGLRYPTRTIFRNPPPVSGTIQTLDTTNKSYNITIANAEPQNSGLKQLWASDGSSYNTGAIEYKPSYNEYKSAPRTIYSASVLYNVFPREDRQLPITGQSLVRDNRISLVALNGSMRETSVQSSSLDFEPISTETRTVRVESEPNEQIVLRFPTRMSSREWRGLFENEPNVDKSDITRDKSAFDKEGVGLLRVPLQPDPAGNQEFYRVQLAKVGIGTGQTTPNPAYLSPVDGNGSSVSLGNKKKLTVEIRDRYNKPTSGRQIVAVADSGEFADGTKTVSATSGPDGRVTFTYQPGAGKNLINFTSSSSYQPTSGGEHDTTAPENVTMTVSGTTANVGGGGSGGSGAYNVSWLNPGLGNPNVSCSSDTISPDSCEIDANAPSYDLDMTIKTSPQVDSASVSYAVSNRTVGTLGPESGTTNSEGRDTVTLTVTENSTEPLSTYANSGSSGDRINFTVKNIDPNDTTAPTISNFQASNPSGTTVEVTFDSDERLSTIDVGVTNNTGYSVTLDLTDYNYVNNGDGTYTYTGQVDVGGTGDYDAVLNVAEDDAGNDGSSGQSATATVTKPGLFTAVSPDPDPDISNGDATEFVRIKFPAQNTTGWQIEAGSDGDTDEITSDLTGEFYIANDKTDFIKRWGVDESRISDIELSNIALLNGGENLLLKDENGTIRDEFGYNGDQTSNNWEKTVGDGQVAVRGTDSNGNYVDTNRGTDWLIESEGTFFGGESPPGLDSVTVQNAPLNQSDAGVSHDVTLQFNKTMNTGTDPTVGLGGLASSGSYNSSLSTGTRYARQLSANLTNH
jgi:hypothetical protein